MSKVLPFTYAAILKVAIPLMLSSFIQAVVYLTDASFLSRYSTISFDASGNAGLLYVTLFTALAGMSDGVQILIARRIGQGDILKVHKLFSSSFILIFIISSILFCALYFVMPTFLMSYSKQKMIAQEQIDFLSIRSFGLFVASITLTINAFLFAVGKTWLVLISSVVTASSNIFLDNLLIFGTDTIEAIGIKGAALASVFAEILGLVLIFIFLYNSKERKHFQLFQAIKLEFSYFREILKVGSPLFLQSFLALATWTIFFTWIEQMGEYELTVSQNIRAIYFLAFIPVWGFAATTKTYISQYLGKGDYDSLKRIQRRIQFLTILFLVFFFHGAILYPRFIISIVNPVELYLDESASILMYVAGSILIFGIISVKFQTINGSGNTQVSFWIETVSVLVYIIAAYLFIKVLNWDVFWIWTVEYIYFISLGTLSIFYLYKFNWKEKKI